MRRIALFTALLALLAAPAFGQVTGNNGKPNGGGGGSGTVTSVGLSTPSWLSVSGSPVTVSGTLAVTQGTPIPPLEQSVASGTSITPTAGTAEFIITNNTAAAGTLTINAPTGTPADGQLMNLRIQSTNAQTYAWNAAYNGNANLALPAATSGGSKYDYVGFRFNSASSKWDLLASLPGNAAPLPVASGGTGAATLTAHGVLLGEGTSTVSNVAAMAADTVLQGQGATADPAAAALSSCSGAANALTYNTTTHAFGCNTIAGGGSATDVQTFTSSGTWTKPGGTPKQTHAICIGAGGGGGGGILTASGTSNSGGSGGGGSFWSEITLPTASLNATETVTVGAAGTAGTGGATPTAGGNGGPSSFGTTPYVFAGGGGGGGAGVSNGTSTSGSTGGPTCSACGLIGGVNGANGANGNSAEFASSGGGGKNGANWSNGGTSVFGPTGGGSGAGVSTTPTSAGGGIGGPNTAIQTGAAGGAAATTGTSGTTPTGYIGGGGGGGGGSQLATGSAGNGGAGAQGGGGGGGGSALTGATAGNGGLGGGGLCVVATSF